MLAVLVPAIVGATLAAKKPEGTSPESRLVRLVRGYPTTLALAVAFWLSFITVPIVHIATLARRRSDAHIPLVTNARGYHDVAVQICRVLTTHGFVLTRAEAPMWSRAPISVLRTFGGDAFRNYIPERLAYFAGPTLDVVVHPNSLLLRGDPARLAYAQGLVVEALSTADAFPLLQKRRTSGIGRSVSLRGQRPFIAPICY